MLASMPSTHTKKATPKQALAERALRELARRNFAEFCKYMDARYETPAHILLLADKLQQVAKYIQTNGKEGIGRLMIMMPPQHGKSQIASRMFPTWMLGLYPDSRVILASYGVDLAVRHSRYIRDAVTSAEFAALFGRTSVMDDSVEISSDSRSAESWDLAQPHRGGVKAAGVGGGITGLPAHILIVDDPFKNREEAESEARRDLVDDWYRSSARTRLRPNAAVVVFHTRWHPDDLAGRLMQRMLSDPLADQWTIINLPALALENYPMDEEEQRRKMQDGVYLPLSDPLGRKAGQPLWGSAYGEEWLRGTRAELGTYDFEALYQQSPFPKSGQKYRREWFKTVTKIPEGVKIVHAVRLWDKANSTKGDYTAGALMAYGSDGFYYVLDVARGQWSSYERDQKMLKISMADRDQYEKVYIWHQQDPGSAGKDSAEATNRLLMGFPAKFETVTGDKATRSEPMESAFQGGLIFLMKGAWNDVFIDECVAFDRGKNDDQVDAASGAYNKLLEMIGKHRKSKIL